MSLEEEKQEGGEINSSARAKYRSPPKKRHRMGGKNKGK
jgi:hypothetical protein